MTDKRQNPDKGQGRPDLAEFLFGATDLTPRDRTRLRAILAAQDETGTELPGDIATLAAYIDDGLSAAEKSAFEARLGSDPDLRAALIDVHNRLALPQQVAPETLRAAAMALNPAPGPERGQERGQERRVKRAAPKRVPWFHLSSTVAAYGMLAVLGLGTLGYGAMNYYQAPQPVADFAAADAPPPAETLEFRANIERLEQADEAAPQFRDRNAAVPGRKNDPARETFEEAPSTFDRQDAQPSGGAFGLSEESDALDTIAGGAPAPPQAQSLSATAAPEPSPEPESERARADDADLGADAFQRELELIAAAPRFDLLITVGGYLAQALIDYAGSREYGRQQGVARGHHRSPRKCPR